MPCWIGHQLFVPFPTLTSHPSYPSFAFCLLPFGFFQKHFGLGPYSFGKTKRKETKSKRRAAGTIETETKKPQKRRKMKVSRSWRPTQQGTYINYIFFLKFYNKLKYLKMELSFSAWISTRSYLDNFELKNPIG